MPNRARYRRDALKNNPGRVAETRKKVGDWSIRGAAMLDLRKGSHHLNVSCIEGPNGWAVVAASTLAKNAGDVDKVLDQHQHQNLGIFKDLAAAMAAAETYAATWKPGGEDCACDEISPAPDPGPVRRRPASRRSGRARSARPARAA